MPRRKNVQPSYLEHKPTGQAYCRVPGSNGKRKAISLGAFGSPRSQKRLQSGMTRRCGVSANPDPGGASRFRHRG
jgi:hypothetical protein